MNVVVDANIAIAVLHSQDAFHRVALRRCLEAREVAILNITLAEALIHPTRLGRGAEARDELQRLGFRTEVLGNEVAELACELRAELGNRNFPMVDAVVVAHGIVHDQTVLTCDAKWPVVDAAMVEVLAVD